MTISCLAATCFYHLFFFLDIEHDSAYWKLLIDSSRTFQIERLALIYFTLTEICSLNVMKWIF